MLAWVAFYAILRSFQRLFGGPALSVLCFCEGRRTAHVEFEPGRLRVTCDYATYSLSPHSHHSDENADILNLGVVLWVETQVILFVQR